ncbi:hypothetical protein F511_21027 [Dorcoceras hygrometricum]|uniref:Uncharacterized protein n=1 Tax=Dorcoceras hygrometricum TaxID=472368 RepID=A0A2Z7AH62_9LAMI|nr:hypothetical protein F511_21027 [Dorcoceras hygrometricum]
MDTQLNVLSTRSGFREVRLPKSQQGSNRGFPLLRGKTVILHWGSEKRFFRSYYSVSETESIVLAASPPLYTRRRLAPPPSRVIGIRSGRFDEENPFVQNSSVLLVQADEGVSVLVVNRIGDIYRSLPRRADVIVTTVGARHKCQQGNRLKHPMNVVPWRTSLGSPTHTLRGDRGGYTPQIAACITGCAEQCAQCISVGLGGCLWDVSATPCGLVSAALGSHARRVWDLRPHTAGRAMRTRAHLCGTRWRTLQGTCAVPVRRRYCQRAP